MICQKPIFNFWVILSITFGTTPPPPLIVVCCGSSPKCHHALQTTLTWRKLIAMQPTMAEYEWTVHQIKVDLLCYHTLTSVLLYNISIWRIWESNPGFLLLFILFYSHCILIVFCNEYTRSKPMHAALYTSHGAASTYMTGVTVKNYSYSTYGA